MKNNEYLLIILVCASIDDIFNHEIKKWRSKVYRGPGIHKEILEPELNKLGLYKKYKKNILL